MLNPVSIGICLILYLSSGLFCLFGGLMRPLLYGASGILGGFFRFVTRVLDVLLGRVLSGQR